MTIATIAPTDLAAVKRRQQATWGSGDYGVIGTTLSITGELLCEAVDLRAGQRVLDVAAGNGNATLAAARRWTDVTSTDYIAALLEDGRAKAKAERLSVTFQGADAEDLPFADASFDVVLSVFGVMFTPNQEQAAQELLRVCRPGGTIGLANWTPEGFIGQVFRTIGKYVLSQLRLREGNQLRTLDVLQLDDVPVWLIGVQTQRVSEGIRERVEYVRAYLVGAVRVAFAQLNGLPETSRQVEDLRELDRLELALRSLEELGARQSTPEASQDRARAAFRDLTTAVREIRSRVQALEAQSKQRLSATPRGTLYQLVQTWGHAQAARKPDGRSGESIRSLPCSTAPT